MSPRPSFKVSFAAAVGCLCVLLPSLASATPIVLFSTRDVTSSADIDFSGSVVSAINLNGSAVTIGGVNFISGSLAGLSNGGFGDANLGSAAMNDLFNTSQFGASASFTISGAVAGQSYRAQFFGYNRNQDPRPFDVTVEGVLFSNWDVFTVPTVGKLLQADWIQEAGDTSIDFAFAQNGAQIQLSGFLVESLSSPVPEPAAAYLLLAGLLGLAARARRRRVGR